MKQDRLSKIAQELGRRGGLETSKRGQEYYKKIGKMAADAKKKKRLETAQSNND